MYILYVIAMLLAAAWIPIWLQFYWNWRQRRNPISLSICLNVGILLYINVASPLFLRAGVVWTQIIVVALNGLGCLHFYASFWWAKQKFRDQRE